MVGGVGACRTKDAITAQKGKSEHMAMVANLVNANPKVKEALKAQAKSTSQLVSKSAAIATLNAKKLKEAAEVGNMVRCVFVFSRFGLAVGHWACQLQPTMLEPSPQHRIPSW